MGELLEQRREYVERRLSALVSHLDEAERLAGDKACVYLTGSFGRGEASEHSDLDVFIVGRGTDERPALRRFADRDEHRRYAEQAREFGDQVFALLQALGDGPGRPFYRLLVV